MSPYQDEYGEVNPLLINSQMMLDNKKFNHLMDLWNSNLLIEEINHNVLTQEEGQISY